MTLVPWTPRTVPALWLNVATGAGVDATGRPVTIGNGGPLRVRDVLDLADYTDAPRVMLTGPGLPAGWLLTDAPGWEHGAHHLDHATPTGRYYRTGAQQCVEVRRAAEWFGEGDYTPATAAAAWEVLRALVAATFGHGAGLLGSPGATGRELWLRSCPRDKDTGRTITPPQAPPEVADLIRSTSGQHRIELRPPATETMPGLTVLDGRLMYAACVRELGVGGALGTADQAAALLDSPRGQYARARYRVRATVPAWWDTVGILPAMGEEGRWDYPNEPGRTFTTWADAAEVHLARTQFRWDVQPLEAILFDKGRPLDLWAQRMLRAHAATPDPLVRAAVRAMLLYSVGAWHSSGRTETTVTAGAMIRPAGDGWGVPGRTDTGAIWRRTVPLEGRAALMTHPEWSAQIWGRARARVLWAPTADKTTPAGALMTDPATVVSIYGDAVMTTTAPTWAAPALDDGAPGRLRLKGHLCGPLPWPVNGLQRDALMHAAQAATAAGDPCTCQEN